MGDICVCVCASALSCNGESGQSTGLESMYLSDQSQGRGVGDGGMRTVDCREEQKWLPISSP